MRKGFIYGVVLGCTALCGCPVPPSSPDAGCASVADAGDFQGTLWSINAGALTVDLDAGGTDLGPSSIPDGGASHAFEWYCVTDECAFPRDVTITFQSANGSNGWSVQQAQFGSGSDCVVDGGATAADAGGQCCIHCGANGEPCGDYCISAFDTCTSPSGCACP